MTFVIDIPQFILISKMKHLRVCKILLTWIISYYNITTLYQRYLFQSIVNLIV